MYCDFDEVMVVGIFCSDLYYCIVDYCVVLLLLCVNFDCVVLVWGLWE